MSEDLTLSKAIENLSRRGDIALPRHDDKEVTDAVILALRELVAIRRQLIGLGVAVIDAQTLSSMRQSYYGSQTSKDGFPGLPAE